MKRDTQIFDLIDKECQRQKQGLELIASENFVITEDVKLSTKRNSWLLIAHANFSEPNSPTYNPTREHKPTLPCSLLA